MRTLETARNVINSEEVEQWLTSTFTQRYPELVLWINSVVRKWVVKRAVTVPATDLDTENLPEWLRTAMQKGDVPERVVLDDALLNRIQPVLDYMADLVATKPDTNVAALGFDVAEQRSIKWHAQMVKKTTAPEIITEDGSDVIKTYPDGYTWRTVKGKDAMTREGELMGHCVGRFSYHAMVLRAKVEIVSLRDPQNDPHVTIEIGSGGTTIAQIKGRANKAVVDKYLPYVEDFLKSRTWTTINFDGAEPLRQKITNHQIFKGKPWFSFDGYRAGMSPSNYGNTQRLTLALDDDDTALGSFSLATEEGNVTLLTDVEVQDQGHDADQFFLELCRVKNVRMAQTSKFAESLKSALKFTKTEGWCQASDDFTRAYLLAIIDDGSASVCIENKAVVAWYTEKDNNLYIGKDNDKVTSQAIAIQLGKPANCIHTGFAFCKPTDFVADINMTSWLKKMLAGRSIKTETDESLLNSLLVAVKQPDAAAIKAGYMRLKAKDKITDADLKALGFATGGRAVNAIGTILLCSLPIKNTAPFRTYVFHKPNTMTCWLEVLAQPDHLQAALMGYGIGATVIKQIMDLLRNEFLRLIPTTAEIEELDLDSGVAMKLKQALVYAKSHKQNAVRSKALWAAL